MGRATPAMRFKYLPFSAKGANYWRRGRDSNSYNGRAAVVIAPSLHRQSPKNGNIRGRGWRLSAIGAQDWRNWESGDKIECAKAGVSGPLSRLLRSLAERWNGWLGREDSNLNMANWNIVGGGKSGVSDESRQCAGRSFLS
jgi:hypothetical protein